MYVVLAPDYSKIQGNPVLNFISFSLSKGKFLHKKNSLYLPQHYGIAGKEKFSFIRLPQSQNNYIV
jgi:hypothetical protein